MKLLLTTFCLLLIAGSLFPADTSGYFGDATITGGSSCGLSNWVKGMRVTANAGIDVEIDSGAIANHWTNEGAAYQFIKCGVYRAGDTSFLGESHCCSSNGGDAAGEYYWRYMSWETATCTLKTDTSYWIVGYGGPLGIVPAMSVSTKRTGEAGDSVIQDGNSWFGGDQAFPDPMIPSARYVDSAMAIKIFWHGTLAGDGGGQMIIIGYVDGAGNWVVTGHRSDIWKDNDN